MKTQIEPSLPKEHSWKPIDKDPQVPHVQPDRHEAPVQVQAHNQRHAQLLNAKLIEMFVPSPLGKPPPWPWKQTQRPSSLMKCDEQDYSLTTLGHALLSKNASANKLNCFLHAPLNKLLLLSPLKLPLPQPQNLTPHRYNMMKPYLEYPPTSTPLSAPSCTIKWKCILAFSSSSRPTSQ